MAETQQTLRDAFIDELRDVYDAEKQLIKALPKMAEAASSLELKEVFENHLVETQGQRAEHYEMAAYGTLVAWARSLGHAEAAQLLEETLNEEKMADEKLTALAESSINDEAAALAGAESDGDESEEETAVEAQPPVATSTRKRTGSTKRR